jgi:sugar lactone lactonase YvrE
MRVSLSLIVPLALFITACSKKNDTSIHPFVPTQNTPSVITWAGSGTVGSADGTKAQGSFNFPTGIAIDGSGFLFVADKQNHIIRIISPQGVINTIAGTAGALGFSNVKDSVKFNFPAGVGVDAAGTVYVADQFNSLIRAINTQGVVSTFAGKTGIAGLLDGAGTAALFNGPMGIATDISGNIYVADNGNNAIRKITAKGIVSTFAGSGSRGATDGPGAAATFNQPQSLAVDGSGNVYVADRGNNLIRKISPQGVVTTIAGTGSAGSANGAGTAASFNGPAGIAVDADGNLYIGDSANNLIRKIAPNGTVTTLAGTGAVGSVNGALTASTFNNPQGVAVDTYGRIYVADTGNSLIRLIQQ